MPQPPKKNKSDVTLAPPPQSEGVKLPSLMPMAPEPSSPATSQFDISDVHAGKRIGKYQIGKLIGRGGMGAVYEATDVPLQRKVALKILPHEFSANEEALQRFVREARLAARLNHPNTVAVYEIAKKGTVYFIAMELVRGASGQEMLERGTKLDWKEVTRAIMDACRGLSAAHSQGMIHRDIKPGNLLWTENGSVKVSDFGLAKPPKTEDLSLTRRDQFVGTPLYMSPEQCRNDNVDYRSDIYSLGATYFTMLSGKAPFNQGSALQILFAHCSAPVPDISESNPDVPPMCAHVIQKAMAKRPEERYQSADDMLADLETVAGTSPEDQAQMLQALSAAAVAAPMITAESLVASKRRSHMPWIVGSSIAVVLVLGLLLGIFMIGERPDSRAESEAQARPKVTIVASNPPVVAQPAPAAPVVAPKVEPTVVTPAPAAPPPAVPAAVATVVAPQPAPVSVVAPSAEDKKLTVATKEPAVETTPEPAKPIEAPKVVKEELTKAESPETAPPTDDASAQPRRYAQQPPRRENRPDNRLEGKPGDVNTDPLMRRLKEAKDFADEAIKSKDPKQKETAAQILVLWYDFLHDKAPLQVHKRLAPGVKDMAEKLKPGIMKIEPRGIPEAEDIDIPLPPTDAPPPPPEDRDRQRPEDRQPPPRRQPPQRGNPAW